VAAAAAQAQAAKTIETSAQTKEGGKAEIRRDGAAKPAPADRGDKSLGDKALIVSPDVPRPKDAQEPSTQLSTGSETIPLPLAGKSKGAREEEVVPMSPIRRRIAQRLVEAQHTAALLTTFNEVDMSAVMALRNEHKQTFQDRYGVKLGFMSFFVKASIDALKLVPQVNAYIRGNDIVYHNFYDIGIAVGGGKGLVVPILRDADRMSFAEIEQAISDLATRARQNSLQLDELQGGTFTISNGGVYGSLLSTPIVNPPQSGILGLHTIQDRVVPRNGEIVIRPSMNLALTYDHRIVDGQGAVTFLKRIKDVIEEPMRMLVEV
jgi:2-oxoglutarate dehydrogenase E2 component (dihydrolipoamide succinyltransferase)